MPGRGGVLLWLQRRMWEKEEKRERQDAENRADDWSFKYARREAAGGQQLLVKSYTTYAVVHVTGEW